MHASCFNSEHGPCPPGERPVVESRGRSGGERVGPRGSAVERVGKEKPSTPRSFFNSLKLGEACFLTWISRAALLRRPVWYLVREMIVKKDSCRRSRGFTSVRAAGGSDGPHAWADSLFEHVITRADGLLAGGSFLSTRAHTIHASFFFAHNF